MPMNRFVRTTLGYAFLLGTALTGLLLLLPISVSRKFREVFLVRVYAISQALWGDSLATVRRRVMVLLDDLDSHDPRLRSRDLLRVLEVGAGPGANLPFVRRRIQYWSLDPNREFNGDLFDAVKRNPKVEMQRSIIGYGENMCELPDGHFDAVLLTYVLCSATDGRKLLHECRRVLSKGGMLLFSEHVAHPWPGLARLLQDVATPLAKRITCGCHLNRDSGRLIREAGFARVHMSEACLDIPFLMNRHVYGFAVA